MPRIQRQTRVPLPWDSRSVIAVTTTDPLTKGAR
jgi:hypothetical protein